MHATLDAPPARLDHEVADGAVEGGAAVVAALGQRQEVLARARRDVAVQLQVEVAQAGVQAHVRLGAGAALHAHLCRRHTVTSLQAARLLVCRQLFTLALGQRTCQSRCMVTRIKHRLDCMHNGQPLHLPYRLSRLHCTHMNYEI